MPHYFVTGATGLIGTQVVNQLLAHGHKVTGLARSDASAEKLESAGASVLRGDVEDLEALKKGAKNSDGVIHLAFIHDFARYNESAVIDQTAIKAMLSVLEGTDKPFVNVSGILLLNSLKPDSGIYYTEASRLVDGGFVRGDTENVVLRAAAKGIRTSVVRLPPTVHGPNDQGFIPTVIRKSKELGTAFYVEKGDNYWPAANVKDAASLLRLVVEKGHGAYHCVAENIPVKDIATAISETFKLPLKSVSKDEATAELGFIGTLLGFSAPSLAERAEKELGWKAEHPTLLEDIKNIYSSY